MFSDIDFTSVIQQIQDIDITLFVISLAVAAVLSSALGVVYVYCGKSLSNRKKFATNFILLALGTGLIITIVKSSLALSLGLVGALSVVRFRTAVKETEELVYLFLAISIGIGAGAQQIGVTILGTAVILVVIGVLHLLVRNQHASNSVYLHMHSSESVELDPVVALLKKYFPELHIQRFENTAGFSASFRLKAPNPSALQAATDALTSHDSSLTVQFIDNELT